jgi:ketosteroid isomerase-like protein
MFMRRFIAPLLFGMFFLLPCAAQENSSPTASTGDVASIQKIQALIGDYAASVNNLDVELAQRVWSARSEVTFIHPRGTERGLNAVLQDFYQNTMGLFSKRELLPADAEIHVYGDTAWSQFTWTFHATLKDGAKEITTKGRETQVYHREDGGWRIVHVHYSGMPETGGLRGF